MSTKPRRCTASQAAALAVGCVVVGLAAVAVARDANAPAGPNAATTQRVEGNDTVVLTNVPRPADANTNLSVEAVELTDEQRTVLSAVRDRDTNLYHNGFYVLLDKARQLDPLSSEELESLEEPIYAKMMRHPEQYRGQPLQLDVYVMTRHKLIAGENLPIRPGVSKGDVIWQLSCYIVGKDMNVSRAMPLTLFSVVDPNEALGSPIPSDTGETLGHYRRARVACLFYKVYKGKDREGKLRTYPAVVAWQFVDRGSVEVGWSPYQLFGVVVVVLLALALLFRMMKRYRKYTAGRQPGKYMPLRDEGEDEEPDDQEEQEETVDGPVDPDLAWAAEEHIRKLRGEESDEQDDSR